MPSLPTWARCCPRTNATNKMCDKPGAPATGFFCNPSLALRAYNNDIRMPQSILLTGATGLLGRYLLRDLLAAGCRIGVLIRGDQRRTAVERLEELLAFACESLGKPLPRPTLLKGDLRVPGL